MCFIKYCLSKFSIWYLFLLVPSCLFAQGRKISGTVTDSLGRGIPAVTIAEEGTNNSTIATSDGNFSLVVSGNNPGLLFSSVGYVTKEVKLTGDQSSVNVVLQTSVASLGEVVLVGYGSVKKKDLTGAVSNVDVKNLATQPVANAGEGIEGKAAGVQVISSGAPGSNVTFRIRGTGTINNADPLVVVDGVPTDAPLNNIDPNDIASIDVLKDASAAAIYGSQASNGVILITTKEGTTSKPVINYSYSYSLQEITNKSMLPLDSKGFLQRLNDRYLTESRTGDDLLTPNPAWDPTTKFVDPSMLTGYQKDLDNNYWKLLTNKLPSIQNHNVTISGKSDLFNYFASFGFTNQENVVKNDDYKRY